MSLIVETIIESFDLLDESDPKKPYEVEKHRGMCGALMALRLIPSLYIHSAFCRL